MREAVLASIPRVLRVDIGRTIKRAEH